MLDGLPQAASACGKNVTALGAHRHGQFTAILLASWGPIPALPSEENRSRRRSCEIGIVCADNRDFALRRRVGQPDGILFGKRELD